MELELLNYIKSHPNWETELQEEPYHLKISRKNGFIMFKYNQLNSDFNLNIVREARGIIFHEADWKVVCWPFRKFFNHVTEEAKQANPDFTWAEPDKLDWSTAIATEKIDGSLIKIWNYDNQWHFSTNGTIDARDAETGDATWRTFYMVFLHAIGFADNLLDFCRTLSKNRTYMFELVSPVTRLVVPYEDFALYYLGTRNNITGEESFDWDLYDEMTKFGVRRPQFYDMESLDNIIENANKLDWKHEGFVVRDANFNRLKVKSPAYLIAFWNRNNNVITEKHLLGVILRNEQEEFRCYASDYTNALDNLAKEMNAMERVATGAKSACILALKASSTMADNRGEFYTYVCSHYDSWVVSFLMKWYSWDEGDLTWNMYTENWDVYRWQRELEKYRKGFKNL